MIPISSERFAFYARALHRIQTDDRMLSKNGGIQYGICDIGRLYFMRKL